LRRLPRKWTRDISLTFVLAFQNGLSRMAVLAAWVARAWDPALRLRSRVSFERVSQDTIKDAQEIWWVVGCDG
jgi:hypothetical protein